MTTLKAWLHSGWRRTILAFVGTTAAAAIIILIATGVATSVWSDLSEGDAVAVTVESAKPHASSPAAVVPRQVAQLPPPAQVHDVYGEADRCPTQAWVRRLGGAPTHTYFTVYIEGLSDRTVILDRVEVEVLQRRPPMRGAYVVCRPPPPAGAPPPPPGAPPPPPPPAVIVPTRTVRVDLDSTPARSVYTVPEERRGAAPPDADMERPARFLFSLKRGDVEAFEVQATGSTCWCSWRLRLGYTVGGERHTLTVDNAGDPFETTGSSQSVGAWYHGRWRVVSKLE